MNFVVNLTSDARRKERGKNKTSQITFGSVSDFAELIEQNHRLTVLRGGNRIPISRILWLRHDKMRREDVVQNGRFYFFDIPKFFPSARG